jgi:hypothetical protein
LLLSEGVGLEVISIRFVSFEFPLTATASVADDMFLVGCQSVLTIVIGGVFEGRSYHGVGGCVGSVMLVAREAVAKTPASSLSCVVYGEETKEQLDLVTRRN